MNKTVEILRKHTMKIVLVLIVIFFTVMIRGQMLAATSFQALIAQNAYVFVLATGMLMCMLTGGNIDLSVGSFVCFIGAIGGIMMVRNEMSVPAAMLLMIGAGVIYGIVEGFLIAYINIPPWIATLAGYLAFRGWGTALLNGGTIAPMPDGFSKMFNGSVPDFFGGAGLNITCILVGVIACVIFVLLQLKGRNDKLKKGYEAESMGSVIVRCVLICVVI
ncbi:MAG: sugar ABC transporter permease, partial [Lachnospiraceae bacterium]|nr:sugar ABC transporter permease [Lachnospiraceae bacterium]